MQRGRVFARPHRELLSACRKRDVKQAVAVLRKHLGKGMETLAAAGVARKG
ncbi:hypothetical protein [Mesorhizobium sp.]|uniref:hypothetical protein n=1 Tax=Mesorhizobium sp. TaxID=1871066 RepID=UPI0025BE56D3|nr:hypothetical protein [Mesorhizobium sp.]